MTLKEPDGGGERTVTVVSAKPLCPDVGFVTVRRKVIVAPGGKAAAAATVVRMGLMVRVRVAVPRVMVGSVHVSSSTPPITLVTLHRYVNDLATSHAIIDTPSDEYRDDSITSGDVGSTINAEGDSLTVEKCAPVATITVTEANGADDAALLSIGPIAENT